jgi:hypothetical protein
MAPDPKSGIWYDKLETKSAFVGSSPQSWVKWPRKTATDEGVGHSTEQFEPGKTIVLARYRVSQKATSSDKIEDPSAGFMIWLEPTK